MLIPAFMPKDQLVPVSISFTDNDQNTANQSSYTFSSKSIGSAAANRKIIVAASNDTSGAGQSVSSLTIGGSPANLEVAQISGDVGVEIWELDVAAGTTADIVVNYAGTAADCAIGVWAIYGAGSSATDTGASTANPLTDTLNIPVGGVAIAAICRVDTSTAKLTNWTNLTEQYDATQEANIIYSGASDAFVSGDASRTITATPASGTPISGAFVNVAYGPG